MTLVEVVVAMFLVVTTMVAVTLTMSRATAASLGITRIEEAASLASEALEDSVAGSCGFAVDPVDQDLVVMADGCDLALGDRDYPPVDDHQVTYRTTRHTRWLPSGSPSADCSASAQPSRLLTTVKTTWTSSGVAKEQKASLEQAPPADQAAFSGPRKGGIIVRTALGRRVELEAGPDLVRRDAEPARPGSATGCAWFPFLTPGERYTVRVDGSPQPPVLVNANRQHLLVA